MLLDSSLRIQESNFEIYIPNKELIRPLPCFLFISYENCEMKERWLKNYVSGIGRKFIVSTSYSYLAENSQYYLHHCPEILSLVEIYFISTLRFLLIWGEAMFVYSSFIY